MEILMNKHLSFPTARCLALGQCRFSVKERRGVHSSGGNPSLPAFARPEAPAAPKLTSKQSNKHIVFPQRAVARSGPRKRSALTAMVSKCLAGRNFLFRVVVTNCVDTWT